MFEGPASTFNDSNDRVLVACSLTDRRNLRRPCRPPAALAMTGRLFRLMTQPCEGYTQLVRFQIDSLVDAIPSRVIILNPSVAQPCERYTQFVSFQIGSLVNAIP